MESTARHRAARALAPALVVTTYALLVFGSTVRIHDAGLACPDWPMCFGEVVPIVDFAVGLEFGHRVLAGIVSLGFLALSAIVLSLSDLRARLWPWLLVAAVVLATQIVLGGLTVLELLAEWTVTSHLVAGNTFCALLLAVALIVRERRPAAGPGVTPLERALPFVLLATVAVQLALGGFVASSHAGLACGPAWPNCGGGAWFPTFSGLVGLQVIHRIGAYAVLAVAAVAAGVLVRRGPVGRSAVVALLTVVGQAALGVVNVWTAMPAEITALHSAGAALTVLVTTWACYEAARAPAAAPVGRAATIPVEVR
jgi:heme a synthase